MLKVSAFYLEKQRPRELQQMVFAVPIFGEGFGLDNEGHF